MTNTVHEGRNIKRIREMLGVKQDTLANDLGWNQQKVSLLEQKERIEPQLLEEVAKALKVPVEAIKNFDEEKAVTYFNTFHDSSTAGGFGISNNNFYCTFNPLDKYVEAMEENKKLYERLLQVQKEKIEILQSLLDERK